MQNKVLLITDVSFWDRSSGNQSRIWELVKYLHSISELTIVYIGIANILNKERKSNSEMFNIFFLNSDEILGAFEYGDLIEKYLQGKIFNVCIIEYIHNAYYLKYIPKNVLTILDVHDIISERNKGFKNYNYGQLSFDLDEESEFEILNMFDYIILLTEKDVQFVKRKIKEKKILLCPHPVTFRENTLRKSVRNVGFIGSEYLPNVDAVEYFISDCWPLILSKYPQLKLNIYGNVVNKIKTINNNQSILLHGFIEDIEKAFVDIDIMVNPVRFGAGLKIKNVESLAYGKPLITTLHGASGLENLIDRGLLVGEQPKDFLKQFSKLVENFSFRKRISREAIIYAKNNLSSENCFINLRRIIA